MRKTSVDFVGTWSNDTYNQDTPKIRIDLIKFPVVSEMVTASNLRQEETLSRKVLKTKRVSSCDCMSKKYQLQCYCDDCAFE